MLEIIIGGTLITGVAIAAAAVVLKKTNDINLDVIGDFNAIKSALAQFRKDKMVKCQGFEDLKPYLDKKNLHFSHYSISGDEKYLIVNTVGLKDTPEELAEQVGGNSYVIGSKVYLSFLTMNKVSKVKPVAKIKYIPADQVYTTSFIDYDATDSTTEDNVISEVLWENNKRRFVRAGNYIVKLKVKDVNNNWSEWTSINIDVKEKPGLAMLATGTDSIYLVRNSGKVDCMGNNEFGQLGINTVTPQSQITFNTFIELVQQVACGDNHTLYKTYDGIIMAAGRNSLGQLGTGNRMDLKTPKEIWGLDGIKQIDAGTDFSAALTHDGRVYVWGDNEHGQLGTDKFTSRDMPTEIEELDNVKQITCGNEHMLALKYDGTVFAWGSNSYGQLAVGFKGKTLLPTQTELSKIVKVIGGKNISFALTESGRVIACGQNNRYQLAMPGTREVSFPEEILALKGIVDIQSKGNFVVAMDAIGDVYTWGQYSNLDDTPFDKPVKLDNLKYVKAIGATSTHGYAITEKEELIKWSSAINRREIVVSEKLSEAVAAAKPKGDLGDHGSVESAKEQLKG